MEKRKRPVYWQGPILAGGRLILTNSLGQIVEASPQDGRVLSTMAGSDLIEVGPIVANGTLFILSNDGVLTAYR